MKKVLFVLTVALLFSLPASAHTQSNSMAPAGGDSGKSEGGKKAKAKESGKQESDPKGKSKEQGKSTTPDTAAATPLSSTDAATSDAPAKTVANVPSGEAATANATSESSNAKPPSSAPLLTNIYRVGPGDVLDIRLLNASTRESTLYTVMADGLLEYPLAGDPVQVAGLTTDEIDALLTSRIKLYENPQTTVSVRQYASHRVIVNGLVNDPGTHVLRREAMPLYVVLAEAQMKPEAGQATIVRLDRQSLTVNLSDPKATTTFVLPGDVITVSAPPPAPPQFFYIGGQISSPGQKDFHQGLTLTQAVLASGGTTRFAGNKVKVSRQGADGRLVTTEYNLKQIEQGKIPDPVLQAGDRIEVSRSGW